MKLRGIFLGLLQAGIVFSRFLWRSLVAAIMSKRVRLIIAATLFIGWLGGLSITALTKSRAPTVSRGIRYFFGAGGAAIAWALTAASFAFG